MTKRGHWWIIASIVILSIATFVALTRQQQNFNDHKSLDKHACELALKNRQLLQQTVEIFHTDPNVKNSASIQRLASLDQQLHQLVIHTKQQCNDDD